PTVPAVAAGQLAPQDVLPSVGRRLTCGLRGMATTVGETAADFLNDNLGLGLTATTIIMSAALAVVLVFQFRARRYVPSLYWLAVVGISIVGTLITDNLVE